VAENPHQTLVLVVGRARDTVMPVASAPTTPVHKCAAELSTVEEFGTSPSLFHVTDPPDAVGITAFDMLDAFSTDASTTIRSPATTSNDPVTFGLVVEEKFAAGVL
jgi:hypothetical protein